MVERVGWDNPYISMSVCYFVLIILQWKMFVYPGKRTYRQRSFKMSNRIVNCAKKVIDAGMSYKIQRERDIYIKYLERPVSNE